MNASRIFGRKSLLTLGFSLSISAAPAAEVVIVEEDFEGDPAAVEYATTGGASVLTVVADPEVGGTRGMVAQVELTGGGEWGGIHVPIQIPLLPLGIVPGTDTYEYTADLYIPSDTVLVDPDTVGLRKRWVNFDGAGEPGKTEVANNILVSALPKDQWMEAVPLSGLIPELTTQGTGGLAIDHAHPFFTFRDVDFGNTVQGIAGYVDNIRLVAETSDEDPNIVVLTDTPFGAVNQAGIRTANISVGNSGTTNDLVISAASITGADMASYSLVTLIDDMNPFTVAPGTSANIEVTFDSSVPAGSYTANLELTTNDVADSDVVISLNALVLEPSGTELIINGGFETGDLTGFTGGLPSPASFEILTAPADPVQEGDHAAVYTMAGGAEWGSVSLDQPAPPAVEGIPDQIAITPEMIGQPYRFSCWFYRPSVNGIADDDLVQMIIRWNGGADSGPFTSLSGAALGADTWVEYVEEDVVPATWDSRDVPPVNLPVTGAFLIFSFRDTDGNAAGTERVYVDNMSFTVEVPEPPVPEPDVRFVDIQYTTGADSVTVTWTSEPGRDYILEYSDDLLLWFEDDDSYPAADEPATTTSWTQTGVTGTTRRYYRVTRNPLPEEQP